MSLDPTGFSVVLFVFLNERSFIHYLDMTLEKTELLPSSDSTWASNLLNEPHFCFTITFAEGREGIRIFDLLAVLNVYARCASSSPTVARWFHLRSEPSWQTRDLWLVSAHVLETSHRRAVPGKTLQNNVGHRVGYEWKNGRVLHFLSDRRRRRRRGWNNEEGLNRRVPNENETEWIHLS